MRNLHGHAVPAVRLRFGPQDCTVHGHTRRRYFASGSGREPDNNEKLRSVLDWLGQPHVQTASAEIIEVGIGLERFPIRIHATHRCGERRAHTRFSPPLYATVKAHQDVIASPILAVYFALNGLSPASFSNSPLAAPRGSTLSLLTSKFLKPQLVGQSLFRAWKKTWLHSVTATSAELYDETLTVGRDNGASRDVRS